MSVYYEIIEEITVNNTDAGTAQILDYIKNQIMDLIDLENAKNVYLNVLSIETGGKLHTISGLRSNQNNEAKISLPSEMLKAVCEMTAVNNIKISLNYDYEWIYSYTKNAYMDYGPAYTTSFITSDVLDDVRYAGIVTCDYDWNANLFVCDRKNGVSRCGLLELTEDFSSVSDLNKWETGNTAIQIEMDYLPEEKEKITLTGDICKKLSERLSEADDLRIDENSFYFALNNAHFNSREDIIFYIENVKQLYELTNGHIYTEPVFRHSSEHCMAVMKIYFDENGQLIIRTARS